MRTAIMFVSLAVATITCWTRGPARLRSDQTRCDLQSTKINLRDEDPQVLKKVEDRWIQAYGERDTRLLVCILADDFEIGSMPDEKLEINNRQHVLDWVASKPLSANHVERLDLRAYQKTAVARGIYSVHTQESEITHRFQFTDVFLYRDAGWQAISREVAELPVR